MEGLSFSLFHFCDNHGPTILLTSKLIQGDSENLSLFLRKADSQKKRAYQCSNCFSLGDDSPYIISDAKDGTHAVSGRSLFQTDEEASKINHIGRSVILS